MRYPNLREIVWFQEEPRNMGAWTFIGRACATLLAERDAAAPLRRAPGAGQPGRGVADLHHARAGAHRRRGFARRAARSAKAVRLPLDGETGAPVAGAT